MSLKCRILKLESLVEQKAKKEHEDPLPYVTTLTHAEISEMADWYFRDMEYWTQDKPDEYYAGLLFQATYGAPMPQGYDWLNGLCDGKHPSEGGRGYNERTV